MCDCNKDCLEIVVLDACPECGTPFSVVADISKDMVEVIMARQEACNALIIAAANALENADADVASVLEQTNNILESLSVADETLIVLTELIDEETSRCENCLCVGCEYAEDCDGTECELEDQLQDDGEE